MKTPRDITGADLAKALRKLGYAVTRQTGSHLRVTTQEHGEHHEVIPNHSPLKIGTLRSILRSVATHHQIGVPELLDRLDLERLRPLAEERKRQSSNSDPHSAPRRSLQPRAKAGCNVARGSTS